MVKYKYKHKHTCRVKKLIAGLAVVSISFSTIINSTGIALGSNYYAETLGTTLSLGSPLSNSSYDSDSWNKWELIAFGVFLSNFVTPFSDDYASAFTEESSLGSKGAGLSALKFNAGGDYDSGGTLTKMLAYAVQNQSQGGQEIKVRYNYYEYDHKMNVDLGTREAYLDDLFPSLHPLGDSSSELMSVYSSAAINRPKIAVYNNDFKTDDGEGTNNINFDTANVSKHSKSSQIGSGVVAGSGVKTSTAYYIGVQSLLPKFFIGGDEEKGSVLDYTNGYDLGIASALLAKVKNSESAIVQANNDSDSESKSKDKSESNSIDEISDMLGRKYKLYFDYFGNICIMKDSRMIVVVPASCNRNIHSDKSINLLNSLVVNSFMTKSNEDKMVAQSSSQIMTTRSWFDNLTTGEYSDKSDGAIGLPASTILYKNKNINSSNVGGLIAYTDTDSYLIPDIMKYLSDKTPNKKSDVIVLDEDAGDGDGNVVGKMKAGSNLGGLYYDLDVGKSIDITDTQANYGDYLKIILSDKSMSNAYFKLEITGADPASYKTVGKWNPFVPNTTEAKDLVSDAQMGLSIASNMFPVKLGDSALTYMYVVNSSKKAENTVQNLFNENNSYYITPAVSPLVKSTTFYKGYANYMLKYASGKIKGASSSSNSISDMQSTIYGNKYPGNLFESVVYSFDNSNFNPLIESYTKSRYRIKNNVDINKYMYNVDSWDLGNALDSVQSTYSKILFKDTNADIAGNGLFSRVCKVYAPSDYFKQIAEVFGLDKNVQFKNYTTNMYLTYLKYYGIIDGNVKFNTSLYSNTNFLNLKSDDYVKTLSAKDKEKDTKNNAYLLLSLTTAGNKYRANLVDNLFKSGISKEYKRIINSAQNTGSGEQIGFLNISNFKDNPITAYIHDNYDSLMMVLFMVMLILTVFKGMLNKESFIWFGTTLATIILSLIIVPKYSDVAPYICNQVIQKVFNGTSIYWGIAEDAQNIKYTNSDYSNNSDSESNSDDTLEQKRIISTFESQSILQQDSYLQVKNDISKKVIEAISDDFSYEKLQSLSSTRWLVPSLIKQLSGDGGTNDYVYISLNELYNNMSLSYLLMNPDAGSEYRKPKFYNKSKYSGSDIRTIDWKKSQMSSYIDNSVNTDNPDETYKSITRLDGVNSNSHSGLYFLDSNALVLPSVANENGEVSESSWKEYANNVSEKLSNQKDIANGIHKSLILDASNYNKNDDSVGEDFPYLWTTENIGVYMYSLVCDTFKENTSNRSLESVAYNLLGNVEQNDANIDVRKNFMYQGSTGNLRDFLDMEEVFTNLIPYMYQMQLTMGGSDGKTGLLGDAKLGDNLGDSTNPIAYSIYKDNLSSWMYRSNWVTKLMSDGKWSKPATVKWKDQKGVVQSKSVSSMIDPRNYPTERPMIFSEAQMFSMGLDESYLNELELTILNINKLVANQWTGLINYVNVKDISKETIYRTMAMQATMTFNSQLTHKGIFDATHQIYPYTIDLRNISFDSVMKKLVGYSNGVDSALTTSSSDMMESLVDNNGIVLGIVMLIIAFLSSVIIPGLRAIVQTALLLMIVVSLVLNLYNDNKSKWKANLGWLLTYASFTGFTCLYYWVYSLVIGAGGIDKVISLGNGYSVSLGMIGFKLVIVLILNACYLFGIIFFIWKYIIKGNWLGFIKDGGFGVFYGMATSLASAIRGGMDNISNGIGGIVPGLSLIRNQDENGNEKAVKVEVANSRENPVDVKSQGDTDNSTKVYISNESETYGFNDDNLSKIGSKTSSSDGKVIDLKSRIDSKINDNSNDGTKIN